MYAKRLEKPPCLGDPIPTLALPLKGREVGCNECNELQGREVGCNECNELRGDFQVNHCPRRPFPLRGVRMTVKRAFSDKFR
jgi:hypothetical protein